MTLILDSGALSALAGQRARLAELRRRDQWPPQIPSVVLTEALTGDHHRDFNQNRLISMCRVRDVTEMHYSSRPIPERRWMRKNAAMKTSVTAKRVTAAAEAISGDWYWNAVW